MSKSQPIILALRKELDRLRTQTYVCTKCGLHAHVSESPCPMCHARAELERLRAKVAELEKEKARLEYEACYTDPERKDEK